MSSGMNQSEGDFLKLQSDEGQFSSNQGGYDQGRSSDYNQPPASNPGYGDPSGGISDNSGGVSSSAYVESPVPSEQKSVVQSTVDTVSSTAQSTVETVKNLLSGLSLGGGAAAASGQEASETRGEEGKSSAGETAASTGVVASTAATISAATAAVLGSKEADKQESAATTTTDSAAAVSSASAVQKDEAMTDTPSVKRDDYSSGNRGGDSYGAENTGGDSYGSGNQRDNFGSSNTGGDSYGSGNRGDNYGSSNTGGDSYGSSNRGDNYGSSNTGGDSYDSSNRGDNYGSSNTGGDSYSSGNQGDNYGSSNTGGDSYSSERRGHDDEDNKLSDAPGEGSSAAKKDNWPKENRDAIPTAGGEKLGEKHWGESKIVPDLPPQSDSTGNVSSSDGQPDSQTRDNTAQNTGGAQRPYDSSQQGGNDGYDGEGKQKFTDKIKDKLHLGKSGDSSNDNNNY